jgi:hypothetical protein
VSNNLPQPSLLQTLKRFWPIFTAAPFYFLALQLPEALTDLLENWLVPDGKQTSPWIILFVLPLFVVASGLTSVLTFSVVLQIRNRAKPSISRAIESILPKFWQIVAASLMIGGVTALGVVACILPGVYLMALYLFVPQSLLDDEKLPLMTHFFRSTQLAKKAFKKTLFIVSIIFISSLAAYFAGEYVSVVLEHLQLAGLVLIALTGLIKVGISILMGVFIDLFVSAFYLSLKEMGNPA